MVAERLQSTAVFKGKVKKSCFLERNQRLKLTNKLR